MGVKLNSRLKNNKGMVIVLSILVMMLILGMGGVLVMRALDTSRFASRNQDSLSAFYEAESGIAYAYAEESRNGFNWYTHLDRTTTITSATTRTRGVITIVFTPPVAPFVEPNSYIDGSGYYGVTGRHFQVKAYPEEISGQYTGVIVIHSQATVNGVTRTLEYRLGQVSAYQYFFFYPDSMTFDTATYDGRNYGGIHIDGDILFRGTPSFKFLTTFTCAGNTTAKGYMIRDIKSKYDNLAPTGSGERAYSTSYGHQQNLPYYLYSNSQCHVYTGETKFTWGNYTGGTNTTVILPYALENATWDWVKYDGTRTEPIHYVIGNENLKTLALYELAGNWNSNAGNNLLDDTDHIRVLFGLFDLGTEKELFLDLYNNHTPNGWIEWAGNGTPEQWWQAFWNLWRNRHNDDYSSNHSSGEPLVGGADWERRFYVAAYNWQTGMGDGVPNNVNLEWWQDLIYGDDDLTANRTVLARTENPANGRPQEQYFLNTSQQSAAFGAWLAANNLNMTGENRTFVGDIVHGARFLDPGKIAASLDQSIVKQKAKSGGIYIGPDDSFAGLSTISGCYNETHFYNAVHTPMDSGRYSKSNVLKIDVHALKQQIESNIPDFNGVLFVDLNGYAWGTPTTSNHNADGVMLVNGERLPNSGLSLATPNNVFIKGNYNLDPDGNTTINRDSDDSAVINYTRSLPGKSYLNATDDPNTPENEAGLWWRPAEIFTQRVVYTLSEGFSEPQTMPMHYHQYYWWEDENANRVDSNIVDHPRWGSPGATWMPTDFSWSPNIMLWAQYNPLNPPQWNITWIESNWGAFDWGDSVIYSFDSDDPDTDADVFISRHKLKNDIYDKVYSCFSNEFIYNASSGPSEYQRANPVNTRHIYNTAIVTPYIPSWSRSTDPFVLENWYTSRVVNGAFIHLSDTTGLSIPGLSHVWSYRIRDPSKTFGYETRFGRNSNQANRPRIGLTFGADSSWREIGAAQF